MATDDNDGPPASSAPGERRARPPSRQQAEEPLDTASLAFEDDLTGLRNRRFVNRLLAEGWRQFVARHAEVSLILIDLDGFKEVNDTYGHAAGDEVLRVVAGLLREHFREGDVVARYGGDEFLVVLPDAGEAVAAALAGRARAAVDTHAFSTAEGGTRIGVPLSFSMGVASCPADGASGAGILEAADRRLYDEKRRRGGFRRQRWSASAVVLALALTAILAGGLAFYFQPPRADAPGARAPRKSVAVLGFKNLSGRADAAWLSTAFAEMLSTELSIVETLRVIPGESVARTKADLALPESDSLAADTLARVRGSLGSDIVVVGSYLALPGSAGQLRLDVRLQDAVRGEALGTVSQTGTEAELLALVARTGTALRGTLGATQLPVAGAAAAQAGRPVTLDAARLYAQGLERQRASDALHARELLEQAIAADPASPLAYSALAETWLALGYDSRAKQAAQRAFELSAKLPREERLLVEARYREVAHEWIKALEIYRTLFGFAPDSLEYGLALARVQSSSGKDRDALVTLGALRKLPAPVSGDARIDVAEAEAAEGLNETKAAAHRAAAKARVQGARRIEARARLLEAYALGDLGEYAEATKAAEEARRIYTEAGDRAGVARALSRIATVRPKQADIAGARALFQESLGIAREIGDRRWTGLVLNNLALTYSDQGDLARARPLYQEALVIAREVGSGRSTAILLTNMGRDLNSQGRPAEGRELLTEALAGYREIGDRGNEVYALNNLGSSAQSLGDLDEAQRLYDEALPIARHSGDKRILAYTVLDLGEVRLARGDLVGARQRQEEALGIRNKLGLEVDAADSRLALARVSIAEGLPEQAEASARAAAAVFAREKASHSQAAAESLVALALLGQGRTAEAVAALARAEAAASGTQFTLIRLAIRTAEGRVLAASGRYAEASRKLQAVLAEATRLALVPEEFEARLALGGLRQRQGDTAGARVRLKALEQDATARGFLLVAKQARELAR